MTNAVLLVLLAMAALITLTKLPSVRHMSPKLAAGLTLTAWIVPQFTYFVILTCVDNASGAHRDQDFYLLDDLFGTKGSHRSTEITYSVGELRLSKFNLVNKSLKLMAKWFQSYPQVLLFADTVCARWACRDTHYSTWSLFCQCASQPGLFTYATIVANDRRLLYSQAIRKNSIEKNWWRTKLVKRSRDLTFFGICFEILIEQKLYRFLLATDGVPACHCSQTTTKALEIVLFCIAVWLVLIRPVILFAWSPKHLFDLGSHILLSITAVFAPIFPQQKTTRKVSVFRIDPASVTSINTSVKEYTKLKGRI